MHLLSLLLFLQSSKPKLPSSTVLSPEQPTTQVIRHLCNSDGTVETVDSFDSSPHVAHFKSTAVKPAIAAEEIDVNGSDIEWDS